MIENVVKEIKQRQQTITEQIQNLQAEASKLEKAISVLGTLGAGIVGEAPAAKKTKAPKAKKRKISAAGRKAIAAAVKARWAAIRAKKAAKAAPAPAPVKKRRLSAAARKAMAAATKARWEKFRAEKAVKIPQAAKTVQGKRIQNKLPLMKLVLKVMQAEKAQSIPEIIVAVNKAGYVSKSKTFASIIGQTLKKAGAKVVRVKRGMYALNN